MHIGPNSVVSFHYRLSEKDGAEIETSNGDHPVLILMGHDNLMPALEEAFQGHQTGDKFTTVLNPEQAYGPRRENSELRVPLKHILHYERLKNRLVPGMRVSVNTEHGPRDVTLIKVGKFNADVDTNHPLAGKHLVFDIDVVEVREASQEELSHGHVHGPGGHHH